MGNFAENLNLGNRFRPPLQFFVGMSDDSTLGQLDYRQLDYLTTRLMDKSTHGQVDSLTTRPIVIIHVRGIIFLPKSLNVMSSCAVKRSVQSPRRNKSRKCNESLRPI